LREESRELREERGERRVVVIANKVELTFYQTIGEHKHNEVMCSMENKTPLFGFEKLEVWKKAKEQSLSIYKITKEWPYKETFGLTSQITRAAVSVAANIAEGTSRFSDKEQKRFFEMAYGSNIELLSHMIIAESLGYCSEIQSKNLRANVLEISKMLSGLMKAKNRKINAQNL